MGSREHQTFLESPDDSAVRDVSETNAADMTKEGSGEEKKNGTSEDETKRDRCPREEFRRLGRAFLEGVFRNLGQWIIDEIRNVFE